jgi:nucleotide-binding universal stress UspA family protein
MITKILMAVDESDAKDRIVVWVRDIATRFHTPVVVFHAYPRISPHIEERLYKEAVAQNIAAAQTLVEEIAARLQEENIAVETDIAECPAGLAILQAAQNHGCDLIVMGARGTTFLEGLLLGSVAERVIRHAHCPVVVIR